MKKKSRFFYRTDRLLGTVCILGLLILNVSVTLQTHIVHVHRLRVLLNVFYRTQVMLKKPVTSADLSVLIMFPADA